MKKLTDLIKGKYYEFNSPPFDMDAVGYVEEDDLISYGDACAEGLIEEDEDGEEVTVYGYIFFYADDEMYVVRGGDMWEEVWEDDRFSTGWGCYGGQNCTASCSGPRAYTLISSYDDECEDDYDYEYDEDDNRILYLR